MPGNKVTIKLTDDQQNQIRRATGKSITELNIDLAATGQLSEKELDAVAGGNIQTTPLSRDQATEGIQTTPLSGHE